MPISISEKHFEFMVGVFKFLCASLITTVVIVIPFLEGNIGVFFEVVLYLFLSTLNVLICLILNVFKFWRFLFTKWWNGAILTVVFFGVCCLFNLISVSSTRMQLKRNPILLDIIMDNYVPIILITIFLLSLYRIIRGGLS